MTTQIEDGTGSGSLAKVSPANRLAVDAVTQPAAVEANESGNAYNLNTGIVNLTDASRTSLIYFKNNEDNDFVIETVVVGIWGSANGDGLDMAATFIRNPTAGDIIDNTNNVAINSNRNYGSNNTLAADVYVGASGETAVTGNEHILVLVEEKTRSFIGINELLPKGTSIAIDLTPPTSNDGMNCYIAIIGYIHGDI